MSKVELGDRVKHVVHGFEGIVTGYHKWLSGCDSVTVRPEMLKDGKPIDEGCFDVTQVVIVKKRAIVVGNVGTTEPTDTLAGGPHDSPPSRSK